MDDQLVDGQVNVSSSSAAVEVQPVTLVSAHVFKAPV